MLRYVFGFLVAVGVLFFLLQSISNRLENTSGEGDWVYDNRGMIPRTLTLNFFLIFAIASTHPGLELLGFDLEGRRIQKNLAMWVLASISLILLAVTTVLLGEVSIGILSTFLAIFICSKAIGLSRQYINPYIISVLFGIGLFVFLSPNTRIDESLVSLYGEWGFDISISKEGILSGEYSVLETPCLLALVMFCYASGLLVISANFRDEFMVPVKDFDSLKSRKLEVLSRYVESKKVEEKGLIPIK